MASGVEMTFSMPFAAYGSWAILDVGKRIEMTGDGFMYAVRTVSQAYTSSGCRLSPTKSTGRHFDCGRPHLLLLFELPSFLST